MEGSSTSSSTTGGTAWSSSRSAWAIYEKNTTLTMIEKYLRESIIASQYMTPEEQTYLTEQIEYCNLFFRNTRAHSMACIFKKKGTRT
jgi:hypothetical protein